jgi:HlyD family secretion protein
MQAGMPVKVYVDAYPNEIFNGEVVNIALQAQFSSRDTQNKEDRANIVFAVKVRLPNADGRLKSGMTADAELELP